MTLISNFNIKKLYFTALVHNRYSAEKFASIQIKTPQYKLPTYGGIDYDLTCSKTFTVYNYASEADTEYDWVFLEYEVIKHKLTLYDVRHVKQGPNHWRVRSYNNLITSLNYMNNVDGYISVHSRLGFPIVYLHTPKTCVKLISRLDNCPLTRNLYRKYLHLINNIVNYCIDNSRGIESDNNRLRNNGDIIGDSESDTDDSKNTEDIDDKKSENTDEIKNIDNTIITNTEQPTSVNSRVYDDLDNVLPSILIDVNPSDYIKMS